MKEREGNSNEETHTFSLALATIKSTALIFAGSASPRTM
jgi:hypothetical protein